MTANSGADDFDIDDLTKDGLQKGLPLHVDRANQRHMLTSAGAVPSLMSTEVTNTPTQETFGETDLRRPYCGKVHWNSLHVLNFPPLYIFGSAMDEYADSDFYSAIRTMNTDGKLSEQWCTYASAREDLCMNTKMPKGNRELKVEVIQYEGQRDTCWRFPLQQYVPKRDNHRPYEVQARRFWDQTVVNIGVNAMDFSEKVKPVGDLECYITMNVVNGNPSWGYYHALMKVGGWPFKIGKIGSYEGFGPDGLAFTPSIHYFDAQCIWDIVEGQPHMKTANGKMELQEGNLRKGCKCWAQLYELDFPGPKIVETQVWAPEIPVEKGYVWFEVVDTVVEPLTGQKAVKIKLLDEGVVPLWMDLDYMQVWCGDTPLGYFNGATSDMPPASNINVYRILDGTIDAKGTPKSKRRIVTENTYGKIVFKDPKDMEEFDKADLGWAIKDCCYQGCSISLSGRPGKWIDDQELGMDEGAVMEKSVRLPLVNQFGEMIDPPNH